MGTSRVEVDPPTGLPVSSVDLLRRRIINVVGHELRTPATSVRGLAEAAATSTDAHERDALLQALVGASRRLERLVEDVLLASSVVTALPVGPAVDVELASCAQQAWAPHAAAGALQVEGRATALAHPDAVRRALDEVLENAAVHGEPPFRATAAVTGGRATLDVASGGPTLRPDELSLATEAFFRGEAAVTNAPGLGLGLAVARTLLEGGGGTLVLQGRDGGGVVATISLPAA